MFFDSCRSFCRAMKSLTYCCGKTLSKGSWDVSSSFRESLLMFDWLIMAGANMQIDTSSDMDRGALVAVPSAVSKSPRF